MGEELTHVEICKSAWARFSSSLSYLPSNISRQYKRIVQFLITIELAHVTTKEIVVDFTHAIFQQDGVKDLQYLHTDLRAFFIFTCCLQLFKMVPVNISSNEPTKALLLSVCCFVKVDHLLKKRRFFPWNKIQNHDFVAIILKNKFTQLYDS